MNHFIPQHQKENSSATNLTKKSMKKKSTRKPKINVHCSTIVVSKWLQTECLQSTFRNRPRPNKIDFLPHSSAIKNDHSVRGTEIRPSFPFPSTLGPRNLIQPGDRQQRKHVGSRR